MCILKGLPDTKGASGIRQRQSISCQDHCTGPGCVSLQLGSRRMSCSSVSCVVVGECRSIGGPGSFPACAQPPLHARLLQNYATHAALAVSARISRWYFAGLLPVETLQQLSTQHASCQAARPNMRLLLKQQHIQ